jgi:D-alanyl-D-alanine carboxypeptidase
LASEERTEKVVYATQRLQDLLGDLVSRKRYQHAVVAVVRGDDSFRWSGAAGTAYPDGTPMSPDIPFHIASVDKLYTASLVMKLHERGRLVLDEPISSYLAQELIGGLHRLDGVDYTNWITIRHLLAHTSGLPDCFETRPKGGRSLMERLFIEGDMAWDLDQLLSIVRNELRPHFPPQPVDARRQRARYSDTNYQLLNAIIETVTRQPLHLALEDWLLRPCGLEHTWLSGHSRPLQSTPEPAALWADNHALTLPRALRSFPSIYGTAADNLTFLRALMRAEIFDRPATLGLMEQRWNRFGLPLDAAALHAPGWPIEYGLGMMRFRMPRLFAPLHPTPALIGHTGSTGSWLFHCPERDLFLCGTVDQVGAGALPYRFVPALVRVLDAALPLPEKA